MNNQNVPEKDRDNIVGQFEELIREECPDMLIDIQLEFDENGFSEMVTSGPKMLTCKILLPTKILSGYMDGAFTFDETNYLGNRIFGWN
jgi:hypothetical protein